VFPYFLATLLKEDRNDGLFPILLQVLQVRFQQLDHQFGVGHSLEEDVDSLDHGQNEELLVLVVDGDLLGQEVFLESVDNADEVLL